MLERRLSSVQVGRLVTLGLPPGLAEVKLKIAAVHGELRVLDDGGWWTNLTRTRNAAIVAETSVGDPMPNQHGTGLRDRAVVNPHRRLSGTLNHPNPYGKHRMLELLGISLEFTTGHSAGE